jgi:phenylacetic acid degradation operon negative regulatory protein
MATIPPRDHDVPAVPGGEPDQRMLSRRLEVGGPSARALLITVLGELVLPTGDWVWTGSLIAVLGLLGVEPSSARQALARTAATGWLVSDRAGRRTRWRLSAAGSTELAEGAQRIYSFGPGRSATGPDRWLLLVASVPEEQRQLRHQLRTRLAWAGFGMLARGAWISPDPDREAEAREVLAELGLLAQATSFLAQFGSIGEVRDLVARAWDVADLRQRYEAFSAHFTSLQPTTPTEALAAQIRLVHEWRRFPFYDPGLPAELLAADPTQVWVGVRAGELFTARHREWAAPAAECWAELSSIDA